METIITLPDLIDTLNEKTSGIAITKKTRKIKIKSH
jgi:hypothetical protein